MMTLNKPVSAKAGQLHNPTGPRVRTLTVH